MEITIREEAGYDLALYGMSLSFKDRAIKPEDWWMLDHTYNDEKNDRYNRIKKTATVNAGRGKGHDKFLRQICLWIDIEAPRYWWSEFDTYKVGTVAQSESTMHTLDKRPMTYTDISDDTYYKAVDTFNECRDDKDNEGIQELKANVPEGYLQRRMVTLNYGVLHTIINQRYNHRLPEWIEFIKALYDQVDHPELLPENPYGN